MTHPAIKLLLNRPNLSSQEFELLFDIMVNITRGARTTGELIEKLRESCTPEDFKVVLECIVQPANDKTHYCL